MSFHKQVEESARELLRRVARVAETDDDYARGVETIRQVVEEEQSKTLCRGEAK